VDINEIRNQLKNDDGERNGGKTLGRLMSIVRRDATAHICIRCAKEYPTSDSDHGTKKNGKHGCLLCHTACKADNGKGGECGGLVIGALTLLKVMDEQAAQVSAVLFMMEQPEAPKKIANTVGVTMSELFAMMFGIEGAAPVMMVPVNPGDDLKKAAENAVKISKDIIGKDAPTDSNPELN